MKKGLLGLLVLGLAVALASPAAAIDWSASGYIAITGNVFRNVTWQQKPQVPGPPAAVRASTFDDTGAYLALRNRLKLTARASKDLYGVMYFEIDSMRFGTTGAGRNNAGQWGADRVAIEVKNIYVDFKIPGIPVWMRPGIIPYAVRPAVFLYRDGGGVSARVKIDPIKMNITGMYGKMRDPDTWESMEGAELYGLDMNLPIGPVKVGGHFFYEDVRRDADLAAFIPKAAGADSATLWWLGAYANGKIGPVTMEADFIYNDGTADHPVDDIDYGSWLIRLVGAFTWEKLEAGLGFMYVAGEDFGDADSSGTFVLPGLVSEGCAICGDTIAFHTGWMGTDPGALQAGMIGPDNVWVGHWILRGFAMFQVLEWMKLGVQVAYIGDTNEDGDLFDPSPDNNAVDPDDDDFVGVELDIATNVTIYKNLSFRGGFGYIIGGDALKTWDGTAWEDPADPWVVVGSLLYTF